MFMSVSVSDVDCSMMFIRLNKIQILLELVYEYDLDHEAKNGGNQHKIQEFQEQIGLNDVDLQVDAFVGKQI